MAAAQESRVLDERAGVRLVEQIAPSFESLLSDTRQYGLFSRRPFRIGQRWDESTLHCVSAMLANWCESRGFDVMQFLTGLDPERREAYVQKLQANKAQAEWEGIIYPTHWDSSETLELIAQLRASGRATLAAYFVRSVLNLK